jgi:BirA family biotin operon repressor/biotin-[acetyl-CoA-carboxylase] ligase
LQIFEFKHIASTNDFLMQQPYAGDSQLCIAEKQTAGKGQFGRVWQTGRKSALFSIKIKLPLFDISGLSLVVGVSCVQILEEYYHIKNIMLKWPNDIFLSGRKLGGILIENQIIDKFQFVVIGVGINIINDSFANLNQAINIKQFVTRIAERIIENIQQFQDNGLEYFLPLWQHYDFLTIHKVGIDYKGSSGVAVGVDKSGALVWSNGNKQVKIYSSNQIQVKL